jgi:hypothetical protein
MECVGGSFLTTKSGNGGRLVLIGLIEGINRREMGVAADEAGEQIGPLKIDAVATSTCFEGVNPTAIDADRCLPNAPVSDVHHLAVQ